MRIRILTRKTQVSSQKAATNRGHVIVEGMARSTYLGRQAGTNSGSRREGAKDWSPVENQTPIN